MKLIKLFSFAAVALIISNPFAQAASVEVPCRDRMQQVVVTYRDNFNSDAKETLFYNDRCQGFYVKLRLWGNPGSLMANYKVTYVDPNDWQNRESILEGATLIEK